MNEKERTLAVFSRTDIKGFNYEEGIARFGGNPNLYVKIIKTFVDNIDPHLERLADLTPEGLGDFAIEVHGVKGSLYGISANLEGDMAKDLEMIAKAGEFEKVKARNLSFITAVNELTQKFQRLLDELTVGESGGQKKPEPDKALLGAMLQASRDFDADKMQEALQELEKFEYEKGGDLVKWLGEQVTAFGYDKIEERLAAIL